MSERWPRVRLGEVLRRSMNTAEILPDSEYQEITVKLWGKGVVQRGTVSGAEIAGSRRLVAWRGQFILSRIDARNGALGIVPPELCGAVVTNDFPLFDLDAERLDSSFLSLSLVLLPDGGGIGGTREGIARRCRTKSHTRPDCPERDRGSCRGV